MRYAGPIGKSFKGDKARAHALQTQASLLVGQLVNRLKAPPLNGYGQLYGTRKAADGSTIHAMVKMLGVAPLIRTWIESPAPTSVQVPAEYYWLATVWVPEGIVITPRTAETPVGWGMPKRDRYDGSLINPPWGTNVPDLYHRGATQCLLNRFANNKYLDKPEYIKGLEDSPFQFPENPCLAASLNAQKRNVWPYPYPPYVHWPYVYTPTPWDSDLGAYDTEFWENWHSPPYRDLNLPGLNKGNVLTDGFHYYPAELNEDGTPKWRQFDENGNSLIYEEETNQWYGHWSEEILYHTPAQETIFQMTNVYRDEVGEDPLFRMLRGHAHPALMVTLEMGLSGVMSHNNEDYYRAGYRTTEERVVSALGSIPYGENLQYRNGGAAYLSNALGQAAAESWRHSPGHYANMISDLWTHTSHHDVWGLPFAQIHTVQGDTDDTPESVDPAPSTVFSQVFVRPFSYGGSNLAGTSEDPEFVMNRGGSYLGSGWVASGAVGNDTPLGRVSWDSTSSPHISTFFRLGIYGFLYGCVIYFLGRAFYFQLGALLPGSDPDDAHFQCLGATAYTQDGQVYLRVVVVCATERRATTQKLVVFDAAINEAMNAILVQGSYTLEATSPDGWTNDFVFSKASFKPDGSRGVFTALQHRTDQETGEKEWRWLKFSATGWGISIDEDISVTPNGYPLWFHFDERGAEQSWWLDVPGYAYHKTPYRLNGAQRLTSPRGDQYVIQDVGYADYGNGGKYEKGSFKSMLYHVDIEHGDIVSLRYKLNGTTPSTVDLCINSRVLHSYDNAATSALAPTRDLLLLPYFVPYVLEPAGGASPIGVWAQTVRYKAHHTWVIRLFRESWRDVYIAQVSNPEGDVYWGSTLDLEALTGLSGIRDISPIGVV